MGEQQVAIQHTHQIDESVEARGDFAGLDGRDMDLRQAETVSKFGLTPPLPLASVGQLLSQISRQLLQPQRFS
jgi:hypothetical protein